MENESPVLEVRGIGEGVIADVVIETTYTEEDEGCGSAELSSSLPLTVMVERNFDEEEEFYINESVEYDDEQVGAASLQVSYVPKKRKLEAKFLAKNQVLHLLLQSQSDVNRVEDEPKLNKYYLLDDNRNFFQGQRKTGRNTFNVDNFKWDTTSLKKHHYMFSNGEFKYVDFIGNQYLLHIPSSLGQKAKRQIMPHQPKPEEILIMRKLYGSIKGVLRRRISYIEKFPAGIEPEQHSLILVEYCEDLQDPHLQNAKSIKLEEYDPSNGIFSVRETFPENESGYDRSSNNFHYSSSLFESTDLEEVETQRIKMGSDNKGIFFDKNEAIQILLNSETTLEEIPQGLKENEYFIINNEENYQRTLEGKRRAYVDDCGVWKNVSMKRHLYTLIDDKYVYVDYIGGSYKISNSTLRGRSKSSLKKSEVLVMRKVYGSLKREESYKRRICWIDEFPENVSPKQVNIALVEYIGKYPKEDAPHGNRKLPGGTPYVRTSTKLMKEMKEKVAHKTAKEVIKEIGIDDNSKSLKQLQNLRYRSNLKISAGSANNLEHNDQLQQILSMVHGHSYVQQTICTKYKPPIVIAYTSQQMNSWRYRCQEKSGLNRVLGVDRTVNVGPYCLTVLTYPHPNLLCRVTSQPSVMMGPVFFHVDKSCQTYSLLFNHIKGCLLNSEKADIDCISVACKPEEEKPIIEALNFLFPTSTVTLCVDHLKMDLKEHLVSEICIPDGIAENIIKEIFSSLMECIEEYDFDVKLLHMQSEYEATIPQFSPYFQKLAENIKHSLWRPTLEERHLHNWSVESCEALKQLVESAESWNTLPLPELILKLYSICQSQEQNEIKALHGEGSFKLAPHAKKYEISKADWQARTNKQRARLAESLRKVRPGMLRTATKPKSDLAYRTPVITVEEPKTQLIYRNTHEVASYY